MLTSNPDLGVEIIQKVYNVANDILWARSSLRTEKYINFLNTNLSKTTQQDQRIALLSTLSSQLQKGWMRVLIYHLLVKNLVMLWLVNIQFIQIVSFSISFSDRVFFIGYSTNAETSIFKR